MDLESFKVSRPVYFSASKNQKWFFSGNKDLGETKINYTPTTCARQRGPSFYEIIISEHGLRGPSR